MLEHNLPKESSSRPDDYIVKMCGTLQAYSLLALAFTLQS